MDRIDTLTKRLSRWDIDKNVLVRRGKLRFRLGVDRGTGLFTVKNRGQLTYLGDADQVQAFLDMQITADSAPADSTPADSAPADSIPADSAPADSTADVGAPAPAWSNIDWQKVTDAFSEEFAFIRVDDLPAGATSITFIRANLPHIRCTSSGDKIAIYVDDVLSTLAEDVTGAIAYLRERLKK